MAGYSIITSGEAVSIKPVQFEVRLTALSLYNWSSTVGVDVYAYRYSGNTISGGTATTPAPLRSGSPACSATCKTGTQTISGTLSQLTGIAVATGSYSSTAPGGPTSMSPSAGNASTPMPMTADVGTTMYIYLDDNIIPHGLLIVTFEEIRLQASY